AGLPLVVGLSAANTHDSHGLKPMVGGLQSRHDPHHGWNHKPGKLHADKAYDLPDLRKWLRGKRIGVRIARKGIESSEHALSDGFEDRHALHMMGHRKDVTGSDSQRTCRSDAV
ncbi:transposase, partial [Streptomyces sp. NPDC087845]